MDRTACVDLPAFPLQLLLKRHPDWRDHPVAVVDSDRPQGVMLQVNERARAARILPGMRYAAGLSLARHLRAAVVAPDEIARAVAAIARRLQRFTPHVEPARPGGFMDAPCGAKSPRAAGTALVEDPGVFWLDASGLERLHDSLERWGRLIYDDLRDVGFRASVTVGFDRFCTYAVARRSRGVVVFERPADERSIARQVPLDRLTFEPRVRNALDKLGVKTVGAFVDLPSESIDKRFGKAVGRLHRTAAGRLERPLEPLRPLPPVLERQILDHPETNVARLMVIVEKLLEPVRRTLIDRHQALVELRIGFRFERLGDHVETIRPAAPTLDAQQLLNLVSLRLGALKQLPDGAMEVVLFGRGTRVSERQMQLLVERPRRDLAAANRALARVRAELGNDRVLRARMRDGHLPEASYAWEPLDKLEAPQPRKPPAATTPTGSDRPKGVSVAAQTFSVGLGVGCDGVPMRSDRSRRVSGGAQTFSDAPGKVAGSRVGPPNQASPIRQDGGAGIAKPDDRRLVRRIYVPAVPLPARPRHAPDGWLLRGLEQGPVVRVRGPYVVSGGWWRKAVHREYHFAETQRGELLWVYYDRPRRRWFLQGRVE